jgi:hypothetical protein
VGSLATLLGTVGLCETGIGQRLYNMKPVFIFDSGKDKHELETQIDLGLFCLVGDLPNFALTPQSRLA